MIEDHFYYFAYGSNISSSTLRKYCPTAEKVRLAKLNDYRLDFQFWATIVPHKNKHVWGVLWLIHNRDILQLDYYEDVKNGLYRVIQVDVEPHASTAIPITCRCYEMISVPTPEHCLTQQQNVNTHLEPGRKPATWYMKNIIDSSIENEIPEYYITELKSVPTVECEFRE
ncbi:hypothetical protein M8J75_001757 [Diaphorina citri]|nr:hypothetical protein M8J75_001757 [Diaphorina citri]